MSNEMRIEILEKRLETAEDFIRHQLDLDWCDDCEEYTETECKTVSGRVGHIDNWLPDEDFYYCECCGVER